jgi:hypothetical protein
VWTKPPVSAEQKFRRLEPAIAAIQKARVIIGRSGNGKSHDRSDHVQQA